MMEQTELDALCKCLFFRNKSAGEISGLLFQIRTSVKKHGRGETIFMEGDPALMIGVVLSGAVEVRKIYPSGKSVILSRFGAGQTFGEAVVFSKNPIFVATVVSLEPSTVLYLAKEEILRLFALDIGIMALFMENLSGRLVLLTQKIEILSLGTLRQRVAAFLLRLAKKEGSSCFTLPYSRKVWAEHLGTARPSLSREICRMRDLGLLSFDGSEFTIKNMEAMENLLME